MARIQRGFPSQAYNAQGSILGPRDPVAVQQPPVVTALAVYGYPGRASQSRRNGDIRRFPLQGLTPSAGEGNYQTARGVSTFFGAPITNASWAAQSFVAPADTLRSVTVRLSDAGSSPDDLARLEIRDDSGGHPGTAVVASSGDISLVGATPYDKKIRFNARLTPGQTYWLVLSRPKFISISTWATGLAGSGTTAVTTDSGLNWSTTAGTWTITATFDAVQTWHRLVGPRPPLVVNGSQPTDKQQTISQLTLTVSIVRRSFSQIRQSRSLLFPPATLAQPPPAGSKVAIRLTAQDHARRFTHIRLNPPVVVNAASAGPPPIDYRVETVLAGRSRIGPQFRFPLPGWSGDEVFLTGGGIMGGTIERRLGPRSPQIVDPIVGYGSGLYGSGTYGSTFGANVETSLVAVSGRNRRRVVYSLLRRPTVSAVSFTAYPISVNCLQPNRLTSRRQISSVLGPPATLRVFDGLRVDVVQNRPRLVKARLSRPTVIRVPQVEQRQQTIRLSLAPSRRPASKSLFRQTIVAAVVAVSAYPIRVSLAKVRQRPIRSLLRPPTVLRTFSSSKANLVTRPRQGAFSRLKPPTVVLVPAIEQTVRVDLVRARPRPTTHSLGQPAVLSVFAGPNVTTARSRPRPVIDLLRQPTRVIPLPNLRAQTISVALVSSRTRAEQSRHQSHYRLQAPTVLSTAAPPNRKQQSILVSLASICTRIEQIRRGPHSKLGLPRVINPLPTLRAQTVRVSLARVRPLRTLSVLSDPATLRRDRFEDELKTTLVRSRPRATVKDLSGPIVLRVFEGPSTSLARVRPRQTSYRLNQPRVIRTAIQDSILVSTVRSRPLPTIKHLLAPTVLRVFEAAFVALVKTKPRATTYKLRPPRVVRTPINDSILVSTVETRPRPTSKFQGEPAVRQRPVELKIASTLVVARPRPITSFLGEPQALRTFKAATVSSVVTRPRQTRFFLGTPEATKVASVEQARRTIKVSLVRIRPRPTAKFLGKPQAVLVAATEQARRTISVSLVVARPQPTTTLLSPPAVIRAAAVVLVPLRVSPVIIRPQPTTTAIRQPIAVHDARAVATVGATSPNEAMVSETEPSGEAEVSSTLTDTIAETSLSEEAEATVSTSKPANAETEAD